MAAVERLRGKICRTFDAVTAVTDADRTALREAAGQPVSIDVVPWTIDTRTVSPVAEGRESGLVVHLGTLLWPPNVDAVNWFCQHVWPRVREQRPDSRFVVVGQRPPRGIRRLSIRSPGVEVRGYVADPGPLLGKAGVFVVPLRAGSGMRVKILTAMAHGSPIVSTTIGCEGIHAVANVHLLVADRPEDFAAAVLRLMEDRVLAREIALNARRLVEETYDYRLALRPLDALYARRAPGRP